MSSRQGGGPSLGLRAAIALALLLGFYVLSAALVVTLFVLLVALAVVIAVYTPIPPGAVGGILLAVTGGGGAAVVRGLFRRVKNDDGPPLGLPTTPRDQPVLWAEVQALAAAVRAPMPAEIHLVPDVNAFVYQRSRLLGLVKGKVVLGVGMGLVNVLDRAQLRAVLAHEFGHISGGDTRLGPLLYRAKSKILSMTKGLAEDDRVVNQLLGKLFARYFALFLSYSMAVSRAQERAADRAAVRVSGSAAASSALARIGVASAVFDLYVESYVVPLWQHGRRPADLYGGYRALFAEPARQEDYARYHQHVLTEETGRWDSHPAIGERLRLIAELPDPGLVPAHEPARLLLADPDGTERALAEVVGRTAVGGAELAPIDWDEAATTLYGPLTAEGTDRLVSAVVALGARWDRSAADQALALVAAGRGLELVRALNPEITDGDAADVDVDRTVRGPLRTLLALELVEHHGGRWVSSWAARVDVAWSGTPLKELVDRALSGPDGEAAVRAELGLPAIPLTNLPPLHAAEETAHVG